MESDRQLRKQDVLQKAMNPSGEASIEEEQTGLGASDNLEEVYASASESLGIPQNAKGEVRTGRHPEAVEVKRTDDGEEASPSLQEDTLKTPRLPESTSGHANPASIESAIVQSSGQNQRANASAQTVGTKAEDYFPPAIPHAPLPTSDANFPHNSSVLPGLPTDLKRPSSPHTPTSVSDTGGPSHHVGTLDDIPADTAFVPATSPGTARPTSVPNFQTAYISRLRDSYDYPQYPDQSFSALQKHPPAPHPLRTRTSNPLQNLSYTSNNPTPAPMPSRLPSGAKTAGNTPAQSPGLYSPVSSKRSMTESDDGNRQTPLLHPIHLQAPKETHNLLKGYDPVSGRKTINQYELFHRLGSGQHGTVKLGRNGGNGEQVAVKIVRRFSKKLRLGRGGDPNDMIKKEVAILKKARHPHVVSLYEVIDDEEFAKVYLVLEYVERGEIIWRKTADRSIAIFEKARLERERSGNYDETYEQVAIQHYNDEVPARREEKIRLYEEQKREAMEQLKKDRHTRKISSLDTHWSLEHGGDDPDNDNPTEAPLPNSESGRDSRLSRADLHAAETANQSQGSPVPMPRSHPYPINLENLSASQPGSRSDSPLVVEAGAFSGFSDENKISDLDLQATLNQIIADHTPWAEDDEDYRHVPCLTLNQALDVFRDTVLGLEYLHFQGIMHRDIKPANLLWTNDYRVKISDFGVSYLGKPIREDTNREELPEADVDIVDEDIELAKTVGTPAFYAPELCDPDHFDTTKNPNRRAITGQIDVWALGVTLYGMIFGRLPFYHPNEFVMYEKIARDEVFISCMRLKGVVHTDKTPSNHIKKDGDEKRPDDVLAYEEVEDTLRDLLKRLLEKNPSQRISLKEVKHHPWVIKGIENREAWLDETDPSVHSPGKIEPSKEEVQDAVVGLTLIDRMKMGVQRLSSLARGRRKRTDSNPKPPQDSPGATSTSRAKEERRSSLGGNEALFTALKASREPSEHHPLSQSVAASPESKSGNQYFPDNLSLPGAEAAPLISTSRPVTADYSLSTADSTKTIRPPMVLSSRDTTSAPSTSARTEDFSNTTSFMEPSTSTPSTISDIFMAPGRFMNAMRSRERGAGRSSPSQSSRASSVDPISREDLHAQPSLAISSAIAAGHVGQPPALRDEADPQPPRSSNASSTDAFAAQEQNRRRQTSAQQSSGHRRSASHAAGFANPPSPDDFIFMNQPRPASAAESTSNFPAVSSSSDILVSGDSTAHSRIPSVVSGASSISVAHEDEFHRPQTQHEKPITVFAVPERSVSSIAAPNAISMPVMAAPTPAQAEAEVEAEAGYNGEPEEESDSEDEGLAMA